ncbi:uncharacterized protein [Lepeophtheirus salmonis]|uniref:uncharacterized protein n=1 Tax=Lepeophtheirus salmonis TaxID=72036 RepID=UPI001AE87211|nr:uncharacterized protein LOC121125588 [Lepeophtheirus salmonis]
MTLNDRILKWNEIGDILKISTDRVYMIHEYLGMRKLCVQWVPRELTLKQKQRLVDDSEQCLKMIERNKSEFLRLYVTMNETWLHHFTPKSNGESSKWTAHDEPAPKRGKCNSRLARILTGKKFSSNEDVIAKTEDYFEAMDKSYNRNGIEKLEDRYNQCITLEGNYAE